MKQDFKEYDYVELLRDYVSGIDFISNYQVTFKKGYRGMILELYNDDYALIEIYEPEDQMDVLEVDLKDVRKLSEDEL